MALLVPFSPRDTFTPFSWLDAGFAFRTFGGLDYRIYRDENRFKLAMKTKEEIIEGKHTWIDRCDFERREDALPHYTGFVDMGFFDPCWTDPDVISTSWKGQEVIAIEHWLRPVLAVLDPTYRHESRDRRGDQLEEDSKALHRLREVAPPWLEFRS